MTRAQARILILLLAHRRIPFKLVWEGHALAVLYDPIHATELQLAVGAWS